MVASANTSRANASGARVGLEAELSKVADSLRGSMDAAEDK